MACKRDKTIRILDTKQMTCSFAGTIDAQRVPLPPTAAIAERLAALEPQFGGDVDDDPETIEAALLAGGEGMLGQLYQSRNGFDSITDNLFYSEGHLVLHQTPYWGLFFWLQLGPCMETG